MASLLGHITRCTVVEVAVGCVVHGSVGGLN